MSTKIDGVGLHSRMRRWREARGMSKAAIARECEVSDTAVAYWEHDDPDERTTPSTEHLAKFCEACGISPAIFWGSLPEARRAS